MSKFDDFRDFVKDKPFLKELVKSKEYTWQDLYERYDLYGPEDEVFIEKEVEEEIIDEEENEEKDEGFSSILGLLSGLDMDKISDSLSSLKKVLNILAEVSKKDEDVTFSTRKKSRPYMKEDD